MRSCRILALLCALTICFASAVSCDGGGQQTTTSSTESSGADTPQDKPVFEKQPTGTVLAFGDSLTYGTKLAGATEECYAKTVADTLGYEYVNCAKAGSEAYAWYSMLTGKAAPNGNKCSEVGDVDRETFTAYIEDADLIVFSLGVNDLASYAQWRSVKDIKNTVLGLINEIHSINSDATVVLVVFGNIFRYNGQEPDATVKANVATFAKELGETLSTEKYSSFALAADVTDVFSDKANFEDVEGNPDYLHPGHSGHAKMAAAVLEYLGVE